MSGATELWALYKAETGSAAERLALYRISSFASEDTGEARFNLNNTIEFLGEPESVVRDALNGLVRKGYLTQVRPDWARPNDVFDDGWFTCVVQFNLDDEYKF